MEVGRELDALVAEKVMGKHLLTWVYDEAGHIVNRRDPEGTFLCGICNEHSGGSGHYWYEAYSTEIAAAWEVVEKLAALNWSMNLEWKGANRVYANTAEVAFSKWIGGDLTNAHCVAATAPLAICLAALKAVQP